MKVKLSDISTIKLGYSLRERLDFSSDSNSTRIILPKDILEGNKIDFSDVGAIELPNPDKFLLQRGEVLLQSRGKFIAVVYNPPYECDFIASSLLLRIIPTSSKVLPEYISLYLNSEIGQAELKRLSGGTITQIITKSELEKLGIPILPIADQKNLISLATEFDNWRGLHSKQMDLQKNIFDSIVNKVLGENNG